MKSKKRINLGRYGEELACEFLKLHSYKILTRNYRTRFGEIDIIAKSNNIFVFLEVKTKTDTDFGTPAEMINKKKQQKLKKLALAYLQEQELSPEEKSFRIDVVSVIIKEDETPEIQHIENAIQKDKVK